MTRKRGERGTPHSPSLFLGALIVALLLGIWLWNGGSVRQSIADDAGMLRLSAPRHWLNSRVHIVNPRLTPAAGLRDRSVLLRPAAALLSDSLKAVRIEAASVLAPVPEEHLNTDQRAAAEYIASLNTTPIGQTVSKNDDVGSGSTEPFFCG